MALVISVTAWGSGRLRGALRERSCLVLGQAVVQRGEGVLDGAAHEVAGQAVVKDVEGEPPDAGRVQYRAEFVGVHVAPARPAAAGFRAGACLGSRFHFSLSLLLASRLSPR